MREVRSHFNDMHFDLFPQQNPKEKLIKLIAPIARCILKKTLVGSNNINVETSNIIS